MYETSEHGLRSGFGSRVLEGRNRLLVLAFVFVAGFGVLGWHSVKLGRATGFDFKNYHYYTAHALLHGRFNLDYAAAQLQTFLNPLPFVPFYLLASNVSAKTTGFVMGGVHGLSLGLVFMLGLTLTSTLHWLPRLVTALGCAAAGVYAPAFLAELGSSGSDNVASLFVVTSVYALVSSIVIHGSPDARTARRSIVAGGILMGVGAGLKLTATMYLIGAMMGLLLTAQSWRWSPLVTMWFGIGTFVGLILSRGFWMALLWKRFDSPLFPFYNKVFGSAYFYDTNWVDRRYLPKSLSVAIQPPFLFLTENQVTRQGFGFRDSRYALVAGLIALLLVVLAGRGLWRLVKKWSIQRAGPDPFEKGNDAGPPVPETVPVTDTSSPATPSHQGHNRAAAFLVIMFVTSFIVWVWKFSIHRYTVAMELLGGVVVVALIMLTVRWWPLRLPLILACFVLIQKGAKPGWYPERSEWTEKYVDVTVPLLEEPDDTLVILAEDRPLSFVIPFFPRGTRFIGLWSNYAKRYSTFPGTLHRGIEEMVELVRNHQGPLYVLSRNPTKPPLRNIKEYGVTQVEGARLRKPASGMVPTSGDAAAHPAVLEMPTNLAGTLYLWPVEVKE